MTIRKRRQPTPHFRLPPPYEPRSGEHAALQVDGVFPYCAMMQVAVADTHEDYVICRGFDIRIPKFVNYIAGDANNPGIPVAKPYGKRVTGMYEVAQVFPAILPLQSSNPSPSSVLWRVGQNPGVSVTTAGHPADLSEEIEILYDDNGYAIDWMLLDTDASDGTNVVLLQAKACFGPGGSGSFNLWEWNGAAWADSTTDVTAYDGAYSVFLLPNEYVWAAKSGVSRYDLIGDVGLDRVGVADSAITCNTSGTVSIHKHTGTGCAAEDSTCNVTACNDWGYTRDIAAGEEVHVRYVRRAWVVIPTPIAMHALAELTATMCPDEAGAVGSVEFQDFCSSETVTTAANTFSLAGRSGDKVFMHRYPLGWRITQVEHHEYDVAVEDEEAGASKDKFIRYSNSPIGQTACEIAGHVLPRVSLMSCEDPLWKNEIDLYSRTFVSAVGSGTDGDCPTLTYTNDGGCMFSAAAESPTGGIFFTFGEALVVTGSHDDGTCAYLEYMAICVASVDQDTASEAIICGSDCESSGSGS